MTIEGQLRDFTRHIDEHQRVISAAEVVQRASGQPPKRTSLDDAAPSRPHLTIARHAGRVEFEPMEELRMSDHPADGEHTTGWRIPAIAAAAVLVVGVGAIAFAVSNTNADDDGVSQAPSATAVPTTAAPTTTIAPRIETGPVPGTDITISYTLPAGWEPESEDGLLLAAGSFTVKLSDLDNVYAGGCEWTPLDPPLGPTVDDLANVWATLPGFTATTPVDITVDGYAGKRVDFTVPDYPTVDDPSVRYNADCVSGRFALWTERGQDDGGPAFWAQFPEQPNRQWIIDVDGTRLVINEWSEQGTTTERLANLDQFLASIQIS